MLQSYSFVKLTSRRIYFILYVMIKTNNVIKAHFSVLSELFVNISAGYIGLLLIAPLVGQNVLVSVIRNICLAIMFYVLAVRLRVR